jgi:hypothetical protein
MKNETRLSILSVLVLASSLVAFSASAGTTPCKDIKSACEAGGFTKGGHKKDNKGLYKDCMQKVMAGETVPGVTVTADQVTACKAKKEKHHAAKEAAKPAT